MSAARWAMAGATWFVIVAGSQAQCAGVPDPLFQSDEILDVRIAAAFTTIMSDRFSDVELPGTLQFKNLAGEDALLNIKLKARGKFRRAKEVCKFAPLRINFQTSQTKGTLFHKQDKVKLVTHCKPMTRYEQAVLREYTAYRILNTLSDASFRVRLLRISYADSERDDDDLVRYGFMIEHRDRLAQRLQASVVDIPNTEIAALDPGYTNLTSMFHYLIGNTDFSPIMAAGGRPCCHNHVLVGNAGSSYRSVPYDFDQSGLVDAAYAVTNPRFKLRNSRQRLYRGRCVNNANLVATIAIFRAKQDEIRQLAAPNGVVDPANGRSMSAFIDKFYNLLESERRIDRAFTKACI